MKKYMDKLEYSVILDQLSHFCNTTFGKELCKNLFPQNTKIAVSNLLAETSEAFNMFVQYKEPPIQELPNISYSIKILESNGILGISALLELASIFKSTSFIKSYFTAKDIEQNSFPLLEIYFTNLYTNPSICDQVFRTLIDENTVADEASCKLFEIRKNERKLEESIKDKLNYFLHSSSYTKYIQESVITIRNNRYVLPVKEEYRSMIKGFVHDVSASGSTLFIEPMNVFELNNELNILKSEEAIEIENILANLSSLFYGYTDELQKNITIIAKLDFLFGKAKYAHALDAVCPNINDKKEIYLLGARHPLIEKHKVIPIDICLGKNYQTLVITGPNTGGKTVTLKTVGLLCLMACSGLFIPVKESSSIYVFDYVYADIGDEQSITQSLSTFSSHMSNMIEILQLATQESLVLLDELGSGTDPIEGSSLAISLLEELFHRNILTIATTHYSELKNYCLVTNGFENASCSFDLENLKPTYQLLIGVPGQSNAFAISQKLGLNEKILSRAKSFLDSDHISIEEIMKSAYDDKLIIEKEKENIIKNSSRIESLRKKLEQKEKELETKKDAIIEKSKQEARKILLDAKEEASYTIQKITEISNSISSNSIKELNQIRNTLNDSIKNTATFMPQENINTTINPQDIIPGNIVWVNFLSQPGKILSSLNKANEIQIQVGNAKMMISISQVTKIDTPNISKKLSGSSSYKLNKTKTATTEINVIGYLVEDAIFTIDKFLDNSVMAKLQNVRIVHGKGTGTLRKGIHQYLKTNPHVKDFRIGTYGEGEMGVTIVNLK